MAQYNLNFDISSYWKHIFLSILIAIIVVFAVVTKFQITTLICILILSFIIFMLYTSDYGSNYAGSLPYATYPLPPHLGLDGVSNDIRFM